MTPTRESPARARVPGRRRWLRMTLLLLVTAVGAVALRGRVPDPAAVVGTVTAADLRWAGGAILAGLLSPVAFATQQRRLLAGYGVVVPRGRMVALTLSRSAMSMALPAGSAVSAVYAFRFYRRHGADGTVAAVVTAVSGILSASAVVLLFGAGWLAADPEPVRLLVGGALVVLLPALLWFSRRRRTVSRRGRNVSPHGRSGSPLGRNGWRGRVVLSRWPALDTAVRGVRELPGRSWAGALRAAMANWLLDLACLAAAAAACGATLGLGRLALIYLAVQLVRQVPLTPGGVGLIEASMLAGLVAAGMPQVTAAAVVLLYRLISFWLVLPIGLAGWLHLRRRPEQVPPAVPSPRRGTDTGPLLPRNDIEVG